VRSAYPIQADDEIVLEFRESTTSPPLSANKFASSAGIRIGDPYTPSAAGTLSGVYYQAVSGSTTDIDVVFGQYTSQRGDGTNQTNWVNGWQWRVRITKKAALPFANATSSATGLVAARKGQYSLTVTSSVAYTSYKAVGIYYQDQDGNHRLKFNIVGTVASGARTGTTLTVTGVTFKNATSYFQAVTGVTDAAATYANVNPNASTIAILHASATTTVYGVSGDVELDSKPTWA
jgi:hypothetical protein